MCLIIINFMQVYFTGLEDAWHLPNFSQANDNST